MNKFESSESFEDKGPIYEKMARLFMISQNPTKFFPLNPKEGRELSAFWEKASEKDKKKIQKLADWGFTYFIYTDKNTPEKEKEELEKKMNEDLQLREYVEKRWARAITEDYVTWRSALEDHEETKKNKARPYEERRQELEKAGVGITEGVEKSLRESAEDYLRRVSMTDEEIRKLFEFLEKYPKEIEESLSVMYSEARTSKTSGKIEIGPSDPSRTYAEFSFLKDIKKYLDGQMSPREENDFNDLIIENQQVREILQRFKNALM